MRIGRLGMQSQVSLLLWYVKSTVFGNAYIIELLRVYVPGQDNFEIMLMSFGLSQGYEDIKLMHKRRDLYAQKAVGYNDKLSADWPNPYSNLAKLEGKLLEELIGRLEKAVFASDGQRKSLGLADEVDHKLHEQFPAGLPDQYPLPLPCYVPVTITMLRTNFC